MSLGNVTYCKIMIFNCKPDLPLCIFQETGWESLEKCKDPDQQVQEGIDSPGSSFKQRRFEETIKLIICLQLRDGRLPGAKEKSAGGHGSGPGLF